MVKPSPKRKTLWLTCQANQVLHKLWWLLHLSDRVKGHCKLSSNRNQAELEGGSEGSAGCLDIFQRTGQHGIWKKIGLIHPAFPSLNSALNENKMLLLMFLATTHFLPLLPLLKITPSITREALYQRWFCLFWKQRPCRSGAAQKITLCICFGGFTKLCLGGLGD